MTMKLRMNNFRSRPALGRIDGSIVLWAVLTGLGALILSGCAAKRPVEKALPSTGRHLVPSGLAVEHTPENIRLSWKTNRQPTDLISGYNIYISAEQRIREIGSADQRVSSCLRSGQTYPGDNDPRTDVETAVLNGLEFGVEYFLHLRTVSADGTIGAPSEEIAVIPRPAGRINLMSRFAGKRDGYSFAKQQYLPANNILNDMYLYVRRDSVFAASPHRLDRTLRWAEFYELGPGESIAAFPRVELPPKGKPTLHLKTGYLYIVSTPENCLAKLYIVGVRKSSGPTELIIDYIYQPRCGVGIF